MKHIKLSRTALKAKLTAFHRCGVRHTVEGATFQEDQFTAAEWVRLEAETMLSVVPVEAPVPDPADLELALRARVALAIAGLADDEFDKSGKPNLGALRSALPDDAGEITGALRDEVWAAMPKSDEDRPGSD